MAKGRKKKPASEWTTDEVINRIFGKGTARKLHKLVAQLDSKKRSGKRGKNDDD